MIELLLVIILTLIAAVDRYIATRAWASERRHLINLLASRTPAEFAAIERVSAKPRKPVSEAAPVRPIAEGI